MVTVADVLLPYSGAYILALETMDNVLNLDAFGDYETDRHTATIDQYGDRIVQEVTCIEDQMGNYGLGVVISAEEDHNHVAPALPVQGLIGLTKGVGIVIDEMFSTSMMVADYCIENLPTPVGDTIPALHVKHVASAIYSAGWKSI